MPHGWASRFCNTSTRTAAWLRAGSAKALNINSSGIGRMAFSFRQLWAKG
ncbi:hypothetical protein [Klebsiella pneumoniae IS46]|nr:hypothetical protein [Klebsiella pneumoniae IS46]CDL44296.1 hypothetical protein [Klebsiella pneumoniae ISC21]CDL60607.1 hypothetical protein [Klebsiella pneumoniae IS39]